LPAIPSFLLFLGSLLILLARRRHERVWWLIAVGVALLSWLYALSLFISIPVTFEVSVWRPEELFSTKLELVLDRTGWISIFSASTLLLTVLMTAVARPGEVTARGRAMMLGHSGLAIVAMLAGNLLTVAITWALMDIAAFSFLASASKRVGSGPLVARLAVDGAGVVLVLGAAVAEAAGDGARPPIAVALISAAVLLRIGLLPPHFALPALPGVRRGLGTLLRFLPPAAALCALGRGLGPGIPDAAVPLLRLGGLLGIVVGSLRWMSDPDAVGGRRFLILGLSGLGVLSSTIGGAVPEIVVSATGVMVLLLGALVSVSEVHAPFHRIWPVLGALFVVGMPFTPGAPLVGALVRGLSTPSERAIAAAGLVGTLPLALGVLRRALSSQTPWPTSERMVKILYGTGLILPLLAGVGLEVWSGSQIGGGHAIVFGALTLLGAIAALVLPRIPRRRLDRWRRLFHYLDPSPGYRLLWLVAVGFLRVLRSLGNLLEGEGAMLWTYVALLLILLAVL
jgi:hypothetical protein